MTKLLTTTITDYDELKELLIKNLPARIKAGNEKHLSNIYEYKTFKALQSCKFINFNTKERISWMIFDIDHVGEITALEYFKNINGFSEYAIEKLGIEPTYVLQTQKGFHFAFHLKNHIYTNQQKPLEYLKAIKKAITALLGCDENASHRLNGIWRNPLLHDYYYSTQFNYELKDFKDFLSKQKTPKCTVTQIVKLDKNSLTVGNRNKALWEYAMRYAKGRTALTPSELVKILVEANSHSKVPLEMDELNIIASSAHKYWREDKIAFGTLTPKEPNPNEGIMKFPKMAFLPLEVYEAEVKRRQQLSAQRTNEIKNQEQAKNQLEEARLKSAQKRQEANQKKVFDAIAHLENEGLKITISAISRVAKLDRRTAGKYYFLNS